MATNMSKPGEFSSLNSGKKGLLLSDVLDDLLPSDSDSILQAANYNDAFEKKF